MTEPQTEPHAPDSPAPCDLLLVGGRVIDPESGWDGVRAVGIRGGTIVHLGDADVPAVRTIDVTGLVVAPGFIDLHSHAQTISGLRLQALDGVTTSLELEAGALPVRGYYERATAEGRPINFGYSAGWVPARMHVLDGAAIPRPQDGEGSGLPLGMFEQNQDGPRWRGPADAREVAEILALIRAQLDDGAIGVGVLAGYAPDSAPEEFEALAALAAETGRRLFIHSRSMAASGPLDSLDAVREIVAASEAHGAPVHLCHLNSTSGQLTAEVAEELVAAQRRGVRVTTEAYPYTAGSTVIGAAFLAPEELAANNLRPSSIRYLATGERIADDDRLREIRAADPGGLCVLDTFDEEDPADMALLMRALTFPGAAIASDAMPLTFFGAETERAATEAALGRDQWPLPPAVIAHPRSTGCFAKALSWLVRERGELDLAEAIRRCTLIPAEILAESVPAMRSKGRIRLGADADITVFDPGTVAPGGDYLAVGHSTGFEHVLVGGVPVVAGGELDASALPGRAIRAATA